MLSFLNLVCFNFFNSTFFKSTMAMSALLTTCFQGSLISFSPSPLSHSTCDGRLNEHGRLAIVEGNDYRWRVSLLAHICFIAMGLSFCVVRPWLLMRPQWLESWMCMVVKKWKERPFYFHSLSMLLLLSKYGDVQWVSQVIQLISTLPLLTCFFFFLQDVGFCN